MEAACHASLWENRLCSCGPAAAAGPTSSALAGQNDVVAVAEHERLRSAPNDLFQVHHRPHPQPELPQQQMLDEVVGEPPGPERQLPVPDRAEADPAQLED